MGVSLFEEALWDFETQDLNGQWCVKVAAAVQNATQCYGVIYDEKKKSYYQASLDPARNQNLCHQRPA